MTSEQLSAPPAFGIGLGLGSRCVTTLVMASSETPGGRSPMPAT
jgi:hypothetical protein